MSKSINYELLNNILLQQKLFKGTFDFYFDTDYLSVYFDECERPILVKQFPYCFLSKLSDIELNEQLLILYDDVRG